MFQVEHGYLTTTVSFTESKLVDDGLIRRLGDQLDQLIRKMSANEELVLDLCNVRFMTSAMIGKLVQVRKAAHHQRIKLRLQNIHPPIRKVFRLTRPGSFIPDP